MENNSHVSVNISEHLPMSDESTGKAKVKSEPHQEETKETTVPYKTLPTNEIVMEIESAHYLTVNGFISYEIVGESSLKFQEIQALFTKNKLCVTSVEEVTNPYLKSAFQVKQESDYKNIKPRVLFHGAKAKHVEIICTVNGAERTQRCGKEIKFSRTPFFAAFFCDRKKGYVTEGTIIIADVLLKVKSPGEQHSVLPAVGLGTKRGKRKIPAKLFDDFYPKYIVQFVRIKS